MPPRVVRKQHAQPLEVQRQCHQPTALPPLTSKKCPQAHQRASGASKPPKLQDVTPLNQRRQYKKQSHQVSNQLKQMPQPPQPLQPPPPASQPLQKQHQQDVITYTPSKILERGLVLRHVSVETQQRRHYKTNKQRFKSEFGAAPAACAKIWEDLQTTTVPEAKIDTKKCKLDHFLLAMNFIKMYPTEKQQANAFDKHGISSENTVRKWRWYFVERIKALAASKIKWPEEWKNPGPDVPIILVTVDGVHYRRNEPTHGRYSKNTKYYSHKNKTAAVNYEIAIHIYKPQVVHFYGPVTASTPDITVFRKELLDKIPDGYFAIADKGYLGECEKVMTPNSHDTPETRKFKGRARARQEAFNKMTKRFKCLDERCIHKEPQHKLLIEAVVVVCQYQIETGDETLFDV
jgi:hypothetical protein